MSELVEFPHDLRKTLAVVHYFHIHPEECDGRMEVFLRINGADYKLVGEMAGSGYRVSRVCLAECYLGRGCYLRPGVEDEFISAVAGLFTGKKSFETSPFAKGPSLLSFFIWRIEAN